MSGVTYLLAFLGRCFVVTECLEEVDLVRIVEGEREGGRNSEDEDEDEWRRSDLSNLIFVLG
jgi:hypothetical protein